jgi:hypothetical protein
LLVIGQIYFLLGKNFVIWASTAIELVGDIIEEIKETIGIYVINSVDTIIRTKSSEGAPERHRDTGTQFTIRCRIEFLIRTLEYVTSVILMMSVAVQIHAVGSQSND